MFSFDFEDSSSDSYNAEDCEVDPSKLLLEAMTKDDDRSKEEDWNVYDKLSIGNAFGSGHHGWRSCV